MEKKTSSNSPSCALMVFQPKITKASAHGIPSARQFHHQNINTWHLEAVWDDIKQLYAIALPMIVTGLILYGKSLISMLFMGRLGKEALAGGSLSLCFANISGYSVLFGLSMGMEAIASQAYGAKKLLLMSHSLQRTTTFLLFVSLPISLLWSNVEPLLLFLGQDPSIVSITSTYLTFSLPDLLFKSILNPLNIYLRSQNITNPLMHCSLFALLLHAPINYLLVDYLELGIRGIAIAGCLTNLNLLISLVVHLHFSQTHIKFWENWSSQCFCEWKPILKLAIPSCITVVLEWWWYEIMILFSGLLSNATESVATMGVLIQITSLVYIFPSSLGQAISTRVGNELGANRPDRAKTATHVALLCAAFTGLIAMSFTMTVGNTWGKVFSSDKAIISLTAMVMPLVGLCELGNCTQTTGCGALRGSARPSYGAYLNLMCFYGVGLPFGYILSFEKDMGLLGLWYGLLAAQVTCAIAMVLVLMRTDWRVQAERAKELTGADSEETEGEERSRTPLLERLEDV